MSKIIDFLRDEKAQSTLELLVAIPTIAITIMVGVIVFESTAVELASENITGSFSSEANNSIAFARARVDNGLSIASISIIMLAAAAALGLIFSLKRGNEPPGRDRF
jgi:hypothetical protein